MDLCSTCRAPLSREAPDEIREPCTKCGGTSRDTAVEFFEAISVSSSLTTEVRDNNNEVIADSFTTDVPGGEVGTGMDYRADSYGRIANYSAGWRPPTKEQVHETVGRALIAAVGGTFEHVDERKELFPDIRVLLPNPVGVEVRHLDDVATEGLYAQSPTRPRTLQLVEEFDALRSAVTDALDAKGDYDQSAMRGMWLAMYLPVAPSQFVLNEIRTAVRLHRDTAPRLFAQVWLVSVRGAERVDVGA